MTNRNDQPGRRENATDGRPLISVVIPSYNAARFVNQAIESVMHQTYSPVEIIVVDDGSTDDTAQILAALGDRICYVHQANGGLSKARNRGIREARGELVAFLDADDKWLPEKLQKQWERLRADPDLKFVHTDVFDLIETTGEVVHEDRNGRRFTGDCYLEFFKGNVIIPSTVLVTRSCLDQIGIFDEEIRGASTQDMDLCLRIARHHRFSYVDEPLVLYRMHPDNASRNRRMMLEDEYFVLAKALRDDPKLAGRIGSGEVRDRMSRLAFGAGYANIDLGDLPRARRHLRNALRYAPFAPRTWTYFVSTFLPNGARRELRSIKQRMSRQPDRIAGVKNGVPGGTNG
jgi:glycosyltransferase involved in cell wall biosynthesis